jgi:hypothetical protein|tara:strand:+ start:1574 stop:1819 length:246 start_codon:yes stop_codon:yes gene_type:complete
MTIKETHNFMCRLSVEDSKKLKVMSEANNRSMTSQIRQFIQDEYRTHGSQMEDHLSDRVEEGERDEYLKEQESLGIENLPF